MKYYRQQFYPSYPSDDVKSLYPADQYNNNVYDDDRNPVLEPRSTAISSERMMVGNYTSPNIKRHISRKEKVRPSTNVLFILIVLAVLSINTLGILYFKMWTAEVSSSSNEEYLEKKVKRNTYAGVVASNRCLSVSKDDADDLSALINSTHQTIIATPAKAAGTSLNRFSQYCNSDSKFINFLNYPDTMEKLLTHSYEMPGVITGHLPQYRPKALIDIIKNVPTDTLLIYSHRQETSRVKSAVKQVITKGCEGYRDRGAELMYKSEGSCYITESNLVKLIKKKPQEIGGSGPRFLTCNTFDAIENYAPTLVFMDYKKVSRLQERIAAKYCPEEGPKNENVGATKIQTYVSISSENGTNTNVTLDDWLETKSSTLEFSLRLNHDASCMATIRKMERELYSCKDGFLKYY